MFEFLLIYPGFVIAIATILTIVSAIYTADKAKNYTLTLSELTVDRESRISLTIGMLVVGIFAGITLLKSLEETSINNLALEILIITSCSLYILTALALFFRWISFHYYCISGYFITAYIVQFATATALHFSGNIHGSLNAVIFLLPFVNLTITAILLLTTPRSWYWEISYAIFTSLFLICLNLIWL